MRIFKEHYFYFILAVLIAFSSCGKKKEWTLKEHSSVKIAIDSSSDSIADKEYTEYLQPFKNELDTQMNVVIGQAAQTLTVSRPESPLSNFFADVYRTAGTKYLKEKKGINEEINIGIANIGGIRIDIPQGEITVGTIFYVMPFENELAVLRLKGGLIQGLCDVFASKGGEGISGIQMGIKDGKAVNVLVNGKPIDEEKIYTVATSDYSASGGDDMIQLTQCIERDDTGIRVRDVLMNYIKEETAKGRAIDARVEGRTYFF